MRHPLARRHHPDARGISGLDRKEAPVLMEVAAYLYPWDVVGDPAAAELIAGLGLHHVVLAAVYHGARALTPRHPVHRVVVAEHTAAYYPLSTDRWDGAVLRPPGAPWTGGTDSFGAAVRALSAAGVGAHAWVVVNHVDLPGYSAFAVINAYGDRYPWALCPAQDAVREYAMGLAEDLADLPGITGVELESFGWYGFDHLCAHDKVSGVALTGAEQYLFSLCFCDGCDGAYQAGGLDPRLLRERIRAVLDPLFAAGTRTGQPDEESAAIDVLLGDDLAGAVRRARDTIVDRYREPVVARIRELRPDLTVLAHISPQPHRYLSFTGIDPARAARLFDGVVVNCWRDTAALAATGSAARDLPVLASLLAVDGMGGRPESLAEQGRVALEEGAAGLRIYHAGLTGARGLDGIRELTETIAKGVDR
jgi:hypothetical protein